MTTIDLTLRLRRRLLRTALPWLLLSSMAATPALAQNPPQKPGAEAAPAASGGRPSLMNPVKPDRESIRRGARVYAFFCRECHGAYDVLGDTPSPPAYDVSGVANLSDAEVARIIAHGRGAMPPLKSQLNQRDIWDTVNFLRYVVKKGPSAPAAPDAQIH